MIPHKRGLAIRFKPLHTADLPLLFSWLDVPHVKEWWRETRDYKEFVNKYTKWIDVDDVGPYLIYSGTVPIGYISWYNASKYPIRTESYPSPTFGIDLFIADLQHRGKGYGHLIIQQFIHELLMPMNPVKIISDPEVTNTRSIHVFEKVGFKKTKIVEATDGSTMVTAQLMEMKL